jgi:hypothetical protein
MLARVIGFFGRRGKQVAGVDKSGNTYFRELQKIDGAGKYLHPLTNILDSVQMRVPRNRVNIFFISD